MSIKFKMPKDTRDVQILAAQGGVEGAMNVALWDRAHVAQYGQAGRVFEVTGQVPGSVTQVDGRQTFSLTDKAEGVQVYAQEDGTVGAIVADAPSQRDGWGAGEHYMLERDATGELVIEPGRNHRRVYTTSSGAGFTAAMIASAEGIAESKVTAAWLKANPVWGSTPQTALDFESLGAPLWGTLTIFTFQSVCSHWLLLEGGYDYLWPSAAGYNIGFVSRSARGESLLHPILVTSYGNGRARITNLVRPNYEGTGNIVLKNVDLAADFQALTCSASIIAGSKVVNSAMNIQCPGKHSYYRTYVSFKHRPTPATATWDAYANRDSGAFMSTAEHILNEECMYDHNGWEDGYDAVGGSTVFGQPPSMYSHNIYGSEGARDCSYVKVMSARGASFGIMARPGATMIDCAMIDNNIPGSDLGGEYKGAGPIGQWCLNIGSLVTSAGYRSGHSMVGAINWGFQFEGNEPTIIDFIACHSANPDDAAEMAAKPLKAPGLDLRPGKKAPVYNDAIDYRFGPVNIGVVGLNTTVLDQTTIQRYAGTKVGTASASIARYMDYVRTLPDIRTEMDNLMKYFRTPYGRWVAPRTAAEHVVFSPDLRGEGFRWDVRINWSSGDIPGEAFADTVNLHGNFVRFNRVTSRVAALAFDGGKLDVVSGKLTAPILSGAGLVTVRECGQFLAPGIAAVRTEVSGGRRVFTGASTGTLAVSGDAECLLGPNYTLAAGQTMTLTGGACWVGWDGTGTAALKLNGALVIKAEGGKLPKIARFRSGQFGAVEPAVTPAVTLAGPLVLDLTGVAVGTYTLVSGTISGAFSSHMATGLAAGRSYALYATASAITLVVT